MIGKVERFITITSLLFLLGLEFDKNYVFYHVHNKVIAEKFYDHTKQEFLWSLC